jgi:hypothetical protein
LDRKDNEILKELSKLNKPKQPNKPDKPNKPRKPQGNILLFPLKNPVPGPMDSED